MPVPITNAQINWSAVGFTPTGGTLTAFTKINGVQIDPGGELLTYKGDADRYPTIVTNVNNTPRITMRSANVAAFMGLAVGATGAWTGTLNDARGVALGGIVYTVANAVVENTPAGGDHAQWAEATASFIAYSSDGVTSPISFTRA